MKTQFFPSAVMFALLWVGSIVTPLAAQAQPPVTQEKATQEKVEQKKAEQEKEQAAPADAKPQGEETPAGEWIQLFNGKDLTGWTPKIRGHQVGENYADTFRVVDGLLTVSYDKYVDSDFLSMDGKKRPSWEKFGHLFYNKPFSHYLLRVEYRFIGDQIKNGPGWAYRNNGLMIHGQAPETMALNQKFPVSIEVQLLGGDGKHPRPTLNLCTPGTNVVIDGKLYLPHCRNSTAPTFHGDQWVTVEVEVRGNKVIRHKVNGKVVLEYTQPQLDKRDAEARLLIKDGNLMLDSGTISIQSESHPTQFRKIELLPLDPQSDTGAGSEAGSEAGSDSQTESEHKSESVPQSKKE